MFKNYMQKKLKDYVRRYFVSHPEVKLVIVVGSIGKTSARTAIATTLSARFRVRMHDGNVSPEDLPFALLGITSSKLSVGTWLKISKAAKKRIQSPADADVIIQGLETSAPGQMAGLSTYIQPDITVVTAVTPDHLQNFGSTEAIAQDDILVANFSKIALINRDDVDGRFASFLTNSAVDTYGTTAAAEYRFEIEDFSLEAGYKGVVILPEYPQPLAVDVNAAGEHSLRPVVAAAAVASKLGMAAEDIATGLRRIRMQPGRMNILRGVQSSTIIDDTENADPVSVAAALQTLYSIDAPQRVAIFGSMNNLGASSPDEHAKIGAMCDPNLLSWVVTIGLDAETYLAPAARAKGCQVRCFKNPIDAGGFVHGVLDDEKAVILATGSEEGIYAEEAVKIILHETHEGDELVRQTPEWLTAKDNFLSKFS